MALPALARLPSNKKATRTQKRAVRSTAKGRETGKHGDRCHAENRLRRRCRCDRSSASSSPPSACRRRSKRADRWPAQRPIAPIRGRSRATARSARGPISKPPACAMRAIPSARRATRGSFRRIACRRRGEAPRASRCRPGRFHRSRRFHLSQICAKSRQRTAPAAMIVLIDNYDSFTFNLVHFLGELGAQVRVHRNDKITSAAVLAADPDAIVLSPGPCTPKEAGICLDLIAAALRQKSRSSASASATRRSATRSAAGWCARRRRCTASSPRSATSGAGIFRGINAPFQATRYHSLVVERASLPDELDRDRRHRGRPHHGAGAYAPAGARRAIPSRKHRLRARPPDAEELSRHRRGLERSERTARRRRPLPTLPRKRGRQASGCACA